MTNVLFISWDPRDSWYLDGLFIPIFEGLLAHGISVRIIQVTWGPNSRNSGEDRSKGRNIEIYYVSLPEFAPRFLRVVLIPMAIWRSVRLGRALSIGLLLPRSIIPGIIAVFASRILRVPILYDCDGFASDEAVEFRDRNPVGIVHRVFRDMEYVSLVAASAVLVRSDFAVRAVVSRLGGAYNNRKRIYTVSNGRPELFFKPSSQNEVLGIRETLGLSKGAFAMVYSGSIGSQYRLDCVIKLFEFGLEKIPELRLVIFTKDKSALNEYLAGSDQSVKSRVSITSLSPNDVGLALRAMNAAVSFREPSFSMKCVAPIKVSEYLLSGLPLITNHSVGNFHAEFVHRVSTLDHMALKTAAEWLERLARTNSDVKKIENALLARSRFGLRKTVNQYKSAIIYSATSENDR